MLGNRRGFSFVEVIVGGAMMALLGLAVTKSLLTLTKSANSLTVRRELAQQLAMLNGYLGSSSLCPNILTTYNSNISVAGGVGAIATSSATSMSINTLQYYYSPTPGPSIIVGPVIFSTVSPNQAFPNPTSSSPTTAQGDWITKSITLTRSSFVPSAATGTTCPAAACYTYQNSGSSYVGIQGSLDFVFQNNTVPAPSPSPSSPVANLSSVGAVIVNMSVPISFTLKYNGTTYDMVNCNVAAAGSADINNPMMSLGWQNFYDTSVCVTTGTDTSTISCPANYYYAGVATGTITSGGVRTNTGTSYNYCCMVPR